MRTKSLIIATAIFISNLVIAEESRFPELPLIEGYDTKKLQLEYNLFTELKPNVERESRMISEIEESVMDGDVEYLPLSDDREFFSIYMEAEEESKGSVIILHSRGFHANWDSTIKPLRVELTKKGWDTLSIQMPVLNKEAKYYDYVPIFPYSHERIVAGIEFLKEQKKKQIILISHGCGSHMAMSFFDEYGESDIVAYVGIGMGATDYKQKLVKTFPLDLIKMPILDIYGENDFPGVIRMAEERSRLMHVPNNSKSWLEVVPGADHYYKESGSVDRLINSIDKWMSKL
jgi:hypothetical protein